MNFHKETSKIILFTSVSAAMLALVGAGCSANRTDISATSANDISDSDGVTEGVQSNMPVPGSDKPVVEVEVSSATTKYKDGTYTVVGQYTSPAGAEQIGVTLTLKNDIITDVSVEPKATAVISVRMQADFAANYKTMVVGKNIADVKLTKVSGSSLTPAGFNDALVKIMAQAKA